MPINIEYDSEYFKNILWQNTLFIYFLNKNIFFAPILFFI